MFSYLIVALFTVLAVSSHPLNCTISSLAQCHSHKGCPTTDCSPTTSSTSPLTTSIVPSPTSSAPVTSSAVLTTVSDVSSYGPFTDGFATYYYQNGNAGACGQVNPDSAFICAMDQARFGTSGPASSLCGQRVQITNMNNGQTVTVTIADDCPTCANQDSIDLSVAAFEAISALSVGIVPISWIFV